uniref:Uncharacterized protein n=1 Tax=Ciona savignyi TaxID=51511 RepID=H2ZCS3_CIOSA
MYNQDVAKPRLTMILKLLLSVDKQATQNQDDDSTVNLERIRSASMTTSNENKEEKTLIHLLYLLNCGNPIQQAKHLIKLISD